MQLTIDVTPVLLRSAGIKNHLHYWTKALERSRDSHEIRYFPYVTELGALKHDKGLDQGAPNWRLFLVAAFNYGPSHQLARQLTPLAQIFHGSTQLRRMPRTARLTSHIHDLTCWLMPEMHTRANVKAGEQLAEHVWRKADGLIAVSQSARNDAERLLGIDPERVQVIYHGVPEEYFRTGSQLSGALRAAYDLFRPYVLSVGTIEPRKNLDRLLDAWQSLPQDMQEQYELLIAGPFGWKSEPLQKRIAGLGSGIRYLGYVHEQDLPLLTAGATALAYPSLYEGFGFPVAQAMACGIPVLTSNVSSMPEVAGGGAILVDPLSVTEIREGLAALLTSPSLRNELGGRGRALAEAQYRWDKIARQSWDFFERIAA